MIIRLNENIFDRIFLFESGNSKRAHRMTRQVIADCLGKTADDPEVIAKEQQFEKDMFGEGLRQDWFITLEPFAAKWIFVQRQNITDVKNILSYLATKASTVQDRTAFMAQVKSFDYFGDLWFFVEKCKKEDRKIARENNVEKSVEKPKLNPNYEVLGPLSFEQAHKYYPKTGGNGASCPICYTEYESTWDSYSNRGANSFFLLLRKDWEKWDSTRAVHDGSEANNGLGEPYNRLNGYDDYGLSMVLVWVTPEGELHESNTRWNHGGNFISPNVDNAFTVDAIQKLMGGKFKDIFNVQSVYETLDTVEEKLASGESLTDIFSSSKMVRQSKNGYSLYEVRLGGYYNLVENLFDEDDKLHRNLIFKDYWAEFITPLNDATDLICEFGGKCYVYTIENNLVPFFNEKYINVLQERIKNGADLNDLFTYIGDTVSGLTPVGFHQTFGDNTRLLSYNIVTSDGNFLSNNWERSAGFGEGPFNSLKIFIGDKENILKEDGTFLFDVPFEKWPKQITYTAANGGIFTITRQDEMNVILRNDFSPITNECYKDVRDTINKEGFCSVQFSDGYYGYVNLRDGSTLGRNMKPVEIQWHFDEGKDLRLIGVEGFGVRVRGAGHVGVEREGEDFMLTKDNELFDADDFIERHKSTFLLRLANGERIEDVFKDSKIIGENVFVNVYAGFWNMLNKERNKLVFPFNITEPVEISGYALIKTHYGEHDYDVKYNLIKPNGELAINVPLDDWCDTIEKIHRAFDCLVLYFGKYINFLTRNGLAFEGDINSWPDAFTNNAYEDRFVHIQKVYNGYKFNILDLNTGKLLWNKPLKHWFDYLDSMSGKELSEIRIGNKCNVYSYYQGLLWKKPLSEWFDRITGWYNADGAIRVIKDNHVNILKENGRLLFKHWVNKIIYHNSDDTYYLELNGKKNIFNRRNGKFLFNSSLEDWPDFIYDIGVMGAYAFEINKKNNIITSSGKLLWNKPYEEWFDGIGNDLCNGYFVVRRNKKGNLLSKNGNLAFNKWYDFVGPPVHGLCAVTEGEGKKEKCNFLNKKGEPISEIWFDGIIDHFNELGFAEITKNRRYNLINKKGKLLINLPNKYWPKDLISTIIRDGNVYFVTRINSEDCYITRNGKYSKNPVAYCKTDLTCIRKDRKRRLRRGV